MYKRQFDVLVGFPTGTFFMQKSWDAAGLFFRYAPFVRERREDMELEIGLALSVLGGLLGVLSFVQSRDKSCLLYTSRCV